MYRIRFHGRGGQGMKTASRILGSAFFRAGYEVQDAPRYGAERRGAPIFAYVRAAHQPIYERGVMRRPDLVVVADDSLIAVSANEILQGVDSHTILLVVGNEAPEVWKDRLNIPGTVLALPHETADASELRFLGTVCAGAAACLVGVLSREILQQAIREELAPLGEAVIARSVALADAAWQNMDAHAGTSPPSVTQPSMPASPASRSRPGCGARCGQSSTTTIATAAGGFAANSARTAPSRSAPMALHISTTTIARAAWCVLRNARRMPSTSSPSREQTS